MRLEEEVINEVSKSRGYSTGNSVLGALDNKAVKNALGLVSNATGLITGNAPLSWALGKTLSLSAVNRAMDGVIGGGIGALDGLSSKVEETVGTSLEDILERGMFAVLRVPGVSESVWLLTIGIKPIMLKLEPEIFVPVMELLRSKGLLIKAMPMILSLATPLLQILLAPEVFRHLGEFNSYNEMKREER